MQNILIAVENGRTMRSGLMVVESENGELVRVEFPSMRQTMSAARTLFSYWKNIGRVASSLPNTRFTVTLEQHGSTLHTFKS